MSVIIRGFNLPAEPMILILHPDGNISTEDYDIGANAKAIELPAQHGRLIDGDSLYKQVTKFTGSPHWVAVEIKQTPTIIEAEDE